VVVHGEPFLGKVYLDGRDFDWKDINALYVSAYDKVNFGIPLVNVVASPKARESGKIEAIFCRTSVANLAFQLPQLVRGERVRGVKLSCCFRTGLVVGMADHLRVRCGITC